MFEVLARHTTRQIYERLHRWLGPPYATRIVEDYLPKQLQKRTLYIVQDDGFFEQAAMLCPCGCKRILHMNLLPSIPAGAWHSTKTAPQRFPLQSGAKRIVSRTSGLHAAVSGGSSPGDMKADTTTSESSLNGLTVQPIFLFQKWT
jgi:hypothetical protein